MWVHTLYTGSICSVCSYSPTSDTRGEMCLEANAMLVTLLRPTTLLMTLILRGKPKRQNHLNPPPRQAGSTEEAHCIQGSGCPSPSQISDRDPLLTNSPSPKIATSKEGMYFPLANLFLHPRIRITDLVTIGPSVFSWKGDNFCQQYKQDYWGPVSNDQNRVAIFALLYPFLFISKLDVCSPFNIS